MGVLREARRVSEVPERSLGEEAHEKVLQLYSALWNTTEVELKGSERCEEKDCYHLKVRINLTRAWQVAKEAITQLALAKAVKAGAEVTRPKLPSFGRR